MALSRRRKLAIASLSLYWPALFIAAHIPVPSLVRQAGVSDKVLHFFAYLILTFLFWFAVNPEGKVNWRKASVWWVFFSLIAYGVVDEWLQGFVGRTCDARDFAADFAGIAAGLLLLSVVSFWPGALLVGGATIFGLTNVARANLADLLPAPNAMFHLFSYAIFAMIWIRCMEALSWFGRSKCKWLAAASGLPLLLLLVVKFFSLILDKAFGREDVILAVIGIIGVVGTVYAMTRLRMRRSESGEGSSG